MKTYSDEVIGLHLLPNQDLVQVWYASETTAEEPQVYEITPSTRVYLDGKDSPYWRHLWEWFLSGWHHPHVSDESLPKKVVCEIEYDDTDLNRPKVKSAKFTRP